MLESAIRNLNKGYISKNVVKKLTEVLVKNTFYSASNGHDDIINRFVQKYGIKPTSFIVLSPTKKCNLHCKDCYASSSGRTAETLSYSVVDRIVSESHDIFGNRFMTISGGEPFLYESDGKTLLDIFEKYNDTFFHIYTNGLCITPEVAKRLGKMGNVTPAISVEGYENETDQRRGKGVFKKILTVFQNLREAGVPFGISITATSKNADLLLSDEFYDYYFDELSATYMWQFQLMPIGRGKEFFKLTVDPQTRVKLYRKWEYILKDKRYCMADFWNSGVLSNGCIAYGRNGGYIYIDWNGNIMPCVFVPYYTDNIIDIYNNGKTIADSLFSDLMKNGRKWQDEYGNANRKKPENWLMPCSIRDHYEYFNKLILTKDTKPEDEFAGEILKSEELYKNLCNYGIELEKLTNPIWKKEYSE